MEETAVITDNAKQQRYEEALVVLAMLVETWPECFKHDGESPVPLAIGIYQQVQSELSGLIDEPVLRFAFSLYCNRPVYRRALLAPGAVRVALDGSTAPVSDIHARDAKRRLVYRRPIKSG